MKRAAFVICIVLGVCVFVLGAGSSMGAQKKAKVSAPPATTTWFKTFGGPNFKVLYAVSHTADGGCVTVGYAFASKFPPPDLWVLRLNARGDKLWERTFPKAIHGSSFYNVRLGPDGSIFVLACKNLAEGNSLRDGLRVIKMDDTGRVIWEKEFGKEVTWYGNALAATADGGCVFGGSRFNKASNRDTGWVIKLDKQGNVVWETFLESAQYEGSALTETPDHHYLFAYTAIESGEGLRVAKLDAAGTVVWQRGYSSFGKNSSDVVQSIVCTLDGGIIVSGGTTLGVIKGFVIKLDAEGKWLWDRGGVTGRASACPADDGGAYVLFCQDYLLVIKLDRMGTMEWVRMLGEPRVRYCGYDMDETMDGHFVLVGSQLLSVVKSAPFVMKVDKNARIPSMPKLNMDPSFRPDTMTKDIFKPVALPSRGK